MELRVDCPPTYPSGCRIVICGEAAGKQEVEQRQGFVGPAGNILNKALFAAGIDRAQIGLTNVSKRAPTAGYDSESFIADFYVTVREGRKKVTRPTDELLAYYDLLRRELLAVKPNLVVAAGQQALKALCGLDGITKYRGSVLPSTLVPGLKVVPIMHPSWVARKAQYQEVWITSQIFSRKVLPESKFPELRYLPWNEYLNPTVEEVERYIVDCSQKPAYTLDIETRAGSIACVGLCFGDTLGGEHAICIPIQTTTGPFYEPEAELRVWQLLAQLLATNPNLVGQNIFYDLAWLREYGVHPSGVHDTMLLFHRMYPEVEKGLDFLAMMFSDLSYYKSDGKTWGHRQPDAALHAYNIKDTVATLRVWNALLAERGHDKAKQLYHSYTEAIMPIAFEMQSLGMEVDPDGLYEARGVIQSELDKIRGKLDVATNGVLTIKPGGKKITDQDKQAYLYGVMGLPPKTNKKTKRLTVEEDAIVELMIAPKTTPQQKVILQLVLAESKFAKAMSSYIDIDYCETPVITPWMEAA